MAESQKKILLIFTGGTLSMVKKDGALSSASQDDILHHIPELPQIADFSILELFNVDSSNMQINHWKKIANTIREKINQYDGFVVVHGTDTMVFTASALSFMLVNLPKPVILTGSQKPISDILSDARANLLFAVHMATLDIPEVCIYFDHQLYRGNRTKKISSTHFSAFSSPNFPPLVTTGVEMEIRSDLIRRPGGLFQVLDSFDDRVISISLFPGMNVEILRHVLEFDIRGIVIQAFGTGTVPNEGKSIIPFIKEASASGKIVVVASQALQGQVNLDLYETARAAKNVGAISGKDMTIETSIIKLMFLQGLSDDIEEVKANFTRNLAGEISD